MGANQPRAVFTARLVPGLRVYTTEIAGVSFMPRGSFLAGLLPATAVYVAAFVGLGAAFGHPILAVIHRIEHQALLVVLFVVAGVVLVLSLRAAVRRTLESVDMSSWAGGAFVLRLESPGIVLIPACIGVNFAGHALANGLGLPLFLDSIGTILSLLSSPRQLRSLRSPMPVDAKDAAVARTTVGERTVEYRLRAVSAGPSAGSSSKRSSRARSTSFISSWAKLAPMQRRRPPPKGIHVYVPGACSRKRSGRKA